MVYLSVNDFEASTTRRPRPTSAVEPWKIKHVVTLSECVCKIYGSLGCLIKYRNALICSASLYIHSCYRQVCVEYTATIRPDTFIPSISLCAYGRDSERKGLVDIDTVQGSAANELLSSR